MTEAPRGDWRGRRAPVIGLWLLQAPVMYLLPAFVVNEYGPSFTWSDMLADLWSDDYLMIVAPIIVSVLVLQAAFVAPVRRPGTHADARPSWPRLLASGLAVGVLASIVTVFVLAILGSIWSRLRTGFSDDQWVLMYWIIVIMVGLAAGSRFALRHRRFMSAALSLWIAGLLCGMLVSAAVFALYTLIEKLSGDQLSGDLWIWSVYTVPLVSWAAATPAIFAFARRNSPDGALSIIANRLFIGTLIESAAILPLEVMVRRRSNCHCGEGSFWSLILLCTVGMLILGPAVYLLPIGRRRQRLYNGCCPACGYDMKDSRLAERCPECGAGWRAE